MAIISITRLRVRSWLSLVPFLYYLWARRVRLSILREIWRYRCCAMSSYFLDLYGMDHRIHNEGVYVGGNAPKSDAKAPRMVRRSRPGPLGTRERPRAYLGQSTWELAGAVATLEGKPPVPSSRKF